MLKLTAAMPRDRTADLMRHIGVVGLVTVRTMHAWEDAGQDYTCVWVEGHCSLLTNINKDA